MTDLFININLKARHVNAHIGGLFVGAPSMMAVNGFAYSVMYGTIRDGGGSCESPPDLAFGMSIHSFSLDGKKNGQSSYRLYRHAPTETPDSKRTAKYETPSRMPHAEGFIHATILIKLSFNDEDENVDLFTQERLARVMRGARLAGGGIDLSYRVKIFDDKEKALRDFARRYGNVVILADHADLSGRDKIGDFMRATRRPLMPEAKKRLLEKLEGENLNDQLRGQIEKVLSDEQRRLGVAGSCIGYLAITPATPKPGVPSGRPHSYVESCIGVVKYVRTVDFFRRDVDGCIACERFMWTLETQNPSLANKRLLPGEATSWVLVRAEL